MDLFLPSTSQGRPQDKGDFPVRPSLPIVGLQSSLSLTPPTQDLCDKLTQSFVTRVLYDKLFNFIEQLFLIASVLESLYLIATLSSLLIASSCNLTVIR